MLNFVRSRVIFAHALLWVAVWFFYVYFFSFNSGNREYVIWFASFLLPITIAVSYYVVYDLIPKHLLTRQYFQLALKTFYTLVFSSYLIVLVIIGSYMALTKFQVQAMPPMAKNVVSVLILVYMIVGMVSFISVLSHNYKTISQNKELRNKILSAQLQLKEQELYYLKKQIHPHFLFNTLNTIYGFAMAQSRQTPDIILKLSNLLDYILYQVEKPMVSLKDEVMHITEYMDLEKIRFQDTLSVEMDIDEIDDRIQVAPMLLIPYVENAFKHGNIVNGYLRVVMELKLNNSRLDFMIKNTVVQGDVNSEKGGVGLENIKKRLELNYGNQYAIDTEFANNWYKVKLSIFNLKPSENEG